jgi:hypothetical protein
MALANKNNHNKKKQPMNFKDTERLSCLFPKALISNKMAASNSLIFTPQDEDTVSDSININIGRLRELPEGESFTYLSKRNDLRNPWSTTVAIKNKNSFTVKYAENDDSFDVQFDNESLSPLFSNLWSIGWFSMPSSDLSNKLESELENASAVSHYRFFGKSFAVSYMGIKYLLWTACEVEGVPFKALDKVAVANSKGIFFFAVAPAENYVDADVKAVVYNCSLNTPTTVAFLHMKQMQNLSDVCCDMDEAKGAVKKYVKEIFSIAKSPETVIPQANLTANNNSTCTSGSGVGDVDGENLQGPRKRKILQRYSPPEKPRNQAAKKNIIRFEGNNKKQSVKGKKSRCTDHASTGQNSDPGVLSNLFALKTEMQQIRKENSELKAELANLRAEKENLPFQSTMLSPLFNAPTPSAKTQESEAFKTMRLLAATQFMNTMNNFWPR